MSLCIFCPGECVCVEVKKPPRKTAPAKAKLTTAPDQIVSPFANLELVPDLPTPDVSVKPASKPKREMFTPYVAPPVAITQSDDEAESAASIRALADVLHPDEKVRFADVLDMKPTVKERSIAWLREREWRRNG